MTRNINVKNRQTRAARLAPLATTAMCALLLAACGSEGEVVTPAVTAQQACATLSGKTVAGATLSAVVVPASAGAPMYCKLVGVIKPSLTFEMRLPDTWNGKFYYGGGAGYDGAIATLSGFDGTGTNQKALQMGYATVNSDGGHQGNILSADFALTDTFAANLFGSLSVPTVAAAAKEILRTAYAKSPEKSYFEGCSNGGREALMAVQRNPNLFDGVIARAPAYNWVGFMGAFNRTARALAAPGGAFSPAKAALLAKHVRNACDELDGIADGIVSNPAACTPARINVSALRCPGGNDAGDTCLSDAQLAVVTSWTSDAEFAGNSTFRNKGWSLTGNEDDPANMGVWVTGNGDVTAAQQFIFQDTTVKNYLARDPHANSLTYAPWDQNQNALYAMAALNDATQADIRPFVGNGGKLILWHGGADPALSVNSTAEYVANVQNAIGAANALASTRFYVAPGVDHCVAGPGADTTDLLTALDQWVTKGVAPGTLTAQKLDGNGVATRTVPLCQYPQYPRYTGPANNAAAAALAANYSCTVP